MIHRAKRCGEIYEDEQDHLVVTHGTDGVVLYPTHDGLSAMINNNNNINNTNNNNNNNNI